MPLDNPDYWLEKYLEQAQQGSRNRNGYLLAAQLRDNRVSKKQAKKTLRRYAERVPRGDHPYTEGQALRTVNAVYNREPREPVEVESDRDQLEESARKRERKLLNRFKQDPTQLTDKERKRLEYSPLSDGLNLRALRIEIAKEHMTPDEKREFYDACPAQGDSDKEQQAQRVVDRVLRRRSRQIQNQSNG